MYCRRLADIGRAIFSDHNLRVVLSIVIYADGCRNFT